MKEQLLAEMGARENNNPLLPISSPFVRWVQQETVPKKFMMPLMAAYNGIRNPRSVS